VTRTKLPPEPSAPRTGMSAKLPGYGLAAVAFLNMTKYSLSVSMFIACFSGNSTNTFWLSVKFIKSE